ncbi:MAG TPA: sulfatase-like hydrolase/transferase [Lacipirellulaceae bacterium]|nr:sulfatase-like hydrolase/transferase [Lacipirellulaceae bacterium]
MTVFAIATLAAAADKTHPNIVFILADDLGPGDIGCYGGTMVQTPNIDRLAAGGTQFKQFYVASPVCSPSRCAMITGQFPARWRITSYLAEKKRNAGAEMVDFLDPQAPSLPRALHEAGYHTAHFGKWHLGGGRDVTDAPKFAAYGYDEHAGTYESPEPDPDITATNWIWSDKDKFKRWQRTQFFVDKTLDFLRRHNDGPCFVNLWFDDVHTPWIPNAEVVKEKNQNVMKNLIPVTAEMDRQIGRLLAGIKDMGIEDNTLVMFASDNGPYPHLPGRTQGLRGCKFSLYEGGTRLPFIARWPGVVPANQTDATTVVGSVDLFPTLCHLANVQLPQGVAFDGVDRSAALMGHALTSRERPLMWEYGRNENFFGYPKQPRDRSPQLAIRDGQWKLLVNADGEGAELYDLGTSSDESTNVATEHPEEAARLKKALLEWRHSMP